MNFQVKLSDEQAWALAEFLKRVGYSDWRSLAVSDEEAWQMRQAADQLRKELTLQGYAPR
jgi:hypothetical protein